MQVMIETESLTKIYYADGREIHAVDDLYLKVFEGEIFGYLGPNGSGKTTTILMLLGLIQPTSGDGWVGGYNIIRESRKIRGIAGYIPERYSFYYNLSAYRNLEYFAKLNHLSRNEIKERIERSIEIVGLNDWINTPVGAFSRGMKQRLALANILIRNPKIIFLDEPTVGLDPKSKADFRELIKRLNREFNLTIFLSSHMLHEVKELCHRIGFLNKGKLIAVDTVESFMGKMGYKIILEVTDLDDKLIDALNEIGDISKIKIDDGRLIIYSGRDIRLEISRKVAEMNRYILTLTLEPPTLEEIFFNIYGE